MSLKSIFNSLKREGYVVAPLEKYLVERNTDDNVRARNVNAPSSAGTCLRSQYYNRVGEYVDGIVDPRTQRIFDNGTAMHERIQGYLLDMGMLIQDEVPLINDEYEIQGHTDGFLDIGGGEIAILELKSINENYFVQLKEMKPQHKCQGLIYLFCAEQRRKFLRGLYASESDFNASFDERRKFYEKHYMHIKNAYKRSEEVNLNMLADNILWHTEKPVNKVVFVYENKNNQELKEYVLEKDEETLQELLKNYDVLNQCIRKEEEPERGARNKSDPMCRWCNYRSTCWIM